MRGTCRIHEKVPDEVVQAFIEKLRLGSEKAVATVREVFVGPGMLALEIVPERETRYDGNAFMMELLEG